MSDDSHVRGERALLLSALATAPDLAELHARGATSPAVTLADLKAARSLLDLLGMALHAGDPMALAALRGLALAQPGPVERPSPKTGPATPFVPTAPAPVRADDTPPGASSGGKPRELTLSQYAVLHAERQHRAQRYGELRARYRLHTEADIAALDDTWRQRLASDPELRSRFDETLSRYVKWLETQRPG